MVALPNYALSTASEYVYALTGALDTRMAFQVFDDRKRSGEAFHRDGAIAEVEPELARMNARGFGVFVYVNQVEGGHKAENVTGLRALFVDKDDGPLPDGLALEPSFVVDSGRGEHGYWLLSPGESVADFEAAQLALAAKLGTVPKVCNPNRVMRLPGFDHCKGEPVFVGLKVNSAKRHTIRQVLDAFGLSAAPRQRVAAAPVDASLFDLSERQARYRAYLAAMGPAVEGSGGDAHTFKAAAVAGDFGLTNDEALPVICEWDQGNAPPWGEPGIKRKLHNANKYRREAVGRKLADDSDVDLSGFCVPEGPAPDPVPALDGEEFAGLEVQAPLTPIDMTDRKSVV